MLNCLKTTPQKNTHDIIKLMKMVSGVTMIFLGQEAVAHDMMLYIQSQGSRAKSPQAAGDFQRQNVCRK